MYNLKIYIKHWYDIGMHKNKACISKILTSVSNKVNKIEARVSFKAKCFQNIGQNRCRKH